MKLGVNIQIKKKKDQKIKLNNKNNENSEILLNQIKTKDKKINDLNEKITQLENEKNTIEKELFEKNLLKSKSKEEIDFMNSKKADKKLKEELIKLRNLYNNKLDENNFLKNENTKILNELESLKNTNVSQENHIKNDQDFFEQIKSFQNEYLEREKKLNSEKNSEILKLKQEIEALKNKLKINEEQNNSEKYLKEITKLKLEKESLEDDIKFFKSINNYVEEEKKKEKEPISNDLFKEELKLKNDEITTLKQENSSLKIELVGCKEKLAETLMKLNDYEFKNGNLKKNTSHYKESY